jgi:hypothetical protein
MKKYHVLKKNNHTKVVEDNFKSDFIDVCLKYYRALIDSEVNSQYLSTKKADTTIEIRDTSKGLKDTIYKITIKN